MIRLNDATLLAQTKLRSRKIRTFMTVAVSALLFSVLIAGSILVGGAFNSVEKFSQEGYGDRYLVQAWRDISDPGAMQDRAVWARAEVLHKELIEEKKTLAAKLDINYDEESEATPIKSDDGSPENAYLNLQSVAAQQALAERKAHKLAYGMPDLKNIAKPYKPIGFYVSDQKMPSTGSIVMMDDGVESFTSQSSMLGMTTEASPISDGFSVTDSELTKPFLLPNNEQSVDLADSIPLLISYEAAEKYLDLAPLDQAASVSDKIERIKELQSKASSIRFEACYRNSVSQQQIQDAISVANDIKKNQNDSDYVKPRLIYGLPDERSCEPAVILSDTRSQEEKDLVEKQQQFDAHFGSEINPDQQKLRFHIVGLTPSPEQSSSLSGTTGELLSSIVGTSLSIGSVAPEDQYSALPGSERNSQIFTPYENPRFAVPSDTFFVEFSSAEDARTFINEKGCTTRQDGSCATEDRPFQLAAFGSNSIALDDLNNKSKQIFTYAAISVVTLATVIMGSTIARMIADGRRETAVFRALGFKKIDISITYLIYTVALSSLVALLAIVIGTGVAYVVHSLTSPELTEQAQLAFNAANFSNRFDLFYINYPELLLITAAMFASGLLGMSLPLLRNTRRNPIQDMRDE